MATMDSSRVMMAPAVDPTNRPFFDAAREGRFLIGKCLDTGKHFFYPRGVSPFTLSNNVELVEASGRGVIYSLTVMRGKEPHAVAYVELEEGPRVFTNIVDCDLDALRIGQAVTLAFRPAEDGQPMPVFKPA
ncbi:Zn-ribbon domain-containing OB-fold protein [Muricoccus radiodurans]|uniref:Zn-ribbon domain-containing OB-fold protein n=1 Tax=Muricoccus radiodurans TaxID=2231721 RepID=UPI003CF2F1B7